MINEKLQKCRVLLQEMKLKKSGKNKFAGFTYYELADFLPAINKLFYDNKLSSNFSICGNEAKLVIKDFEDETFEVFSSPIADLELKGCTAIQALGGIHTYMKRYLYLNALEIVENDMLDAQAGQIETPKQKPAPKVDEETIYKTLNACTSISDVETVWKKYHKQVQFEKDFTDACKAKKEAIQNGNG